MLVLVSTALGVACPINPADHNVTRYEIGASRQISTPLRVMLPGWYD